MPSIKPIIVAVPVAVVESSQPQVVMGTTPISKCQRELEKYLRYMEASAAMSLQSVGVSTANHDLKLAYWTKGAHSRGFAEFWEREMMEREKNLRRASDRPADSRADNPEDHLSGIIQSVDE